MCSQFRYTAANSFAGSFPQSVLCGCQFMYVNTGGFVENMGGETIVHESDPTFDTSYGQVSQPITTFPPIPEHHAKQIALVRAMSGYSYIRSRWRIWWLLHQEAKYQASLRGQGLDFSGEAHQWKDLRPWTSRGIETDGWLHSEVALTLPPQSVPATLVMELELPGWSGLPDQNLEVRSPGGGKSFKLKHGRRVLRVPLKVIKKDAVVHLHMESKFQLPGEQRTATCRLLNFRIEKPAAADDKTIRLRSVVE